MLRKIAKTLYTVIRVEAQAFVRLPCYPQRHSAATTTPTLIRSAWFFQPQEVYTEYTVVHGSKYRYSTVVTADYYSRITRPDPTSNGFFGL